MNSFFKSNTLTVEALTFTMEIFVDINNFHCKSIINLFALPDLTITSSYNYSLVYNLVTEYTVWYCARSHVATCNTLALLKSTL